MISNEFKTKVVSTLLATRENFSGSDKAFSTQYGINSSVYSRLKSGELDGLLKDAQWLSLGRQLGVSATERSWNPARTEVFKVIEQDILFCQEHAKARICVDDTGIGKTFAARYLSRSLRNCFYIDGSQAKTKQLFIRLVARTIGVDHTGKYAEVKENLKYYIKMLPQPIIIIDEAGDLDYGAFLELKELWNATEGFCGWYMIGADGLRAKIDKGIRNKKVGFREIFSRYSDNYTTVVPVGKSEKEAFYRKLISDVLTVNMDDKSQLPEILRRCLASGKDEPGGLRRAESLLILKEKEKNA